MTIGHRKYITESIIAKNQAAQDLPDYWDHNADPATYLESSLWQGGSSSTAKGSAAAVGCRACGTAYTTASDGSRSWHAAAGRRASAGLAIGPTLGVPAAAAAQYGPRCFVDLDNGTSARAIPSTTSAGNAAAAYRIEA